MFRVGLWDLGIRLGVLYFGFARGGGGEGGGGGEILHPTPVRY